MKGYTEAFADLSKHLKTFENKDSNSERLSFIERQVHGVPSSSKQIHDGKNKKETKEKTSSGKTTPDQEEPWQVLGGDLEGSVVMEEMTPCGFLS
jgi:hypothetical protein